MKPSELKRSADHVVHERVAIVGSRPGKDHQKNERRRAAVRAIVWSLPLGTVVVSGGASGVDKWAETYALERGLVAVRCIPPWNAYANKRDAAKARNAAIVDLAERVYALWDGVSTGTSMTIDIARERGKPVEVIRG